MDKGLRKLNLLAHAGRISLDVSIAGFSKAAVFEDFVGSAKSLFCWHSSQLTRIGYELDGAHPGDVTILLGHQADPLPDERTLALDVGPHDAAAAGCRLNEAQHRFDERRFARAIRP